jgi:hypothetical protein
MQVVMLGDCGTDDQAAKSFKTEVLRILTLTAKLQQQLNARLWFAPCP